MVIYYNSGKNAVKRETYMQTMQKAAQDRENAGVGDRLREAAVAAKKAADMKAGPKPDSPRAVEAVMKGRLERGPLAGEEGREGEGDDDGYSAMGDLEAILKRSPIIIFSKTYCPHSHAAKNLFLHEYMIVPAPHVVELDKHPHGSELQDLLAKQTGRRTVPNVMISGKSIGGNDDVQQLEREGRLGDTIHSMGGKRIMRVMKLKG
ncbi:glutaredoxin [Choiromyces venosus 120613-1]|uniref:Glutaredoxin n=1 Tax=Choiromyces venosus 120613-1 TaxID=1336337 RepID=A0A3N4K441_9PEZI|nr:glutaredoxin [Choiromyces venosus 120613-1]